MRCLTLSDLPQPPEGRQGWPWTEACQPRPDRQPNGGEWPRISIVTPSFNQGRFIEETIRSILLQGYPALEYMVIDGGSTDESVAIIRKYEPWLTHWVSEKDRGQSEAINKGMKMATGDIVAWLNSDDVYVPGALHQVAAAYTRNPAAVLWVGTTRAIDLEYREVYRLAPRWGTQRELADWGAAAIVPQPSAFYGAAAFRRAGGVNEVLYYAMDVDLVVRLAALGGCEIIDAMLANFRVYPEAKTSQDYTGPLAEIIAADVNAGLLDVAKHVIKRYTAAARESARDAPTEDDLRSILDRQTYSRLTAYLWRRLVRAVRRRLGAVRTRKVGNGSRP